MAFNERWLHAIQRVCQSAQNQRITILPSVAKNLHLKQDRKHAAVLVALCNQNGNASLLFTKRTDTVGTHKGQVSFPGGHIDQDETAVDAAIREAYEELGGSIGNIQVLGICQTIPAITGTLVTPVIGFLERDIDQFEHFEPNPAEVSLVFSRTIDHMTTSPYKSSETLSRNGVSFEAPCFGSREDSCRIWGLTAMIADAVLSKVIVPTKSEQSFTTSSPVASLRNEFR